MKPKKQPKIEKEQPVEVIPVVPKLDRTFKATVIAQAPNPQWVYVKSPEADGGKLAVIIPRRLTNKLTGKPILIEAISDHTGTSHRYVEGQPH